MKIKEFCLAGLILIPLLGAGQNSLDFRQFYSNPFLFNPAYTGASGYTEFSVSYRQQWLEFIDAPSSSGFSFQQPFKSKASLGVNFYSQNALSLRTTIIQVAFSYRIPISDKSSFRLALSGGAGLNDLDLEGRDYSNDPLIMQAAQNQWYPAGSFGILFSAGELRLGICLPTLFNQQETGSGFLATNRYEHLLNQLYSIRYKIKTTAETWSLEPYFLYRLNRDFQNYWDSGLLIHFKEKLGIGASYHQFNGVAILLAINTQDLSIGYNYELPNTESVSSTSHELQLSIKLGKRY